MMVERHYDDEALIAIMEADRVGSDVHLPACMVCNEKLESFRTISGALHGPDVWDTRELRLKPVPSTIATLRAFADRMAAEDAAAAQILPELLAGSRKEWMPRLCEHPEWRTAGVVRGLLQRMREVVNVMPSDALQLTEMATTIADSLDSAAAPPSTLARLRASAWRDHAYALFYTGAFADALTATKRAERHVDGTMVDEYERARIGIIRALALRAQEDFGTATSTVRASGATFARFADASQYAAARVAEMHLLFSSGDYETASSVLEELERSLRDTGDANMHARVLGNLGYCYWKLGRIDDALRHHEAAAALLDDLGIRTEAVRVRWNIASILATAGRTTEARARLETLRETFSSLGMASEAALVGLDVADLMIAEGEFDAVDEICRAATKSFESAGISYTARALTALAYMREAAQRRTATPALVRHVREYLRRLPNDGELLFAHPLEPSYANRR